MESCDELFRERIGNRVHLGRGCDVDDGCMSSALASGFEENCLKRARAL